MTNNVLDQAIRRVKDFPHKGIVFYDITSLIANPQAFSLSVELLSAIVRDSGAQKIVGTEARGFIFAAAIAHVLSLPLVIARKPGKLPNPVQIASYSLEYGNDSICIQDFDLRAGEHVFIVDDLVATGGTIKAVVNILEKAHMIVCGVGAVIGLPFLGFEKILSPIKTHTLIDFDSE